MPKKLHKKNIKLIILTAVFIAIMLYAGISGYLKSKPDLQYTYGSLSGEDVVNYPDARFAVISDLHYYDKSLGTTGKAYELCLGSDRKLLEDSSYLLDFAINNILASGVKFVLISGDLTKDGELLCHQKVSAELSRLTEKGIKVFVVPGNHDINNPKSVRYEGNNTKPVPNITALQFAQIYWNLGYKDALYRDKDTLSYVAKLDKTLWLVALDTCRYRENKPGSTEIVGGKLLQSQVKWLEEILQKANREKKAVIVMQHHGVVEHWKGQNKLHPAYLIPDYKYVGRLFSSYGVRFCFTGHYHSQDITSADFKKDGFLYDIETCSLVTPPCPIRYCNISSKKLQVSETPLIDLIHPGTDFADKSNALVFSNVYERTYSILKKYKIPEKDTNTLSTQIGKAFYAHINGDENVSKRPTFDPTKLGIWSYIAYASQRYIIDGLWNDLPPRDRNTTLDLHETTMTGGR